MIEPKTGYKKTVDLDLPVTKESSIHVGGQGMIVITAKRLQFWQRHEAEPIHNPTRSREALKLKVTK